MSLKSACLLVLLLVFFACTKIKTIAPVFACPQQLTTADIRGVNWADKRDNYVDGWLLPSGVTATDNYTSVRAKSKIVLNGFKNNLGANTVRLPVNPQTVLQNWWPVYTGTIDEALSNNMHVILACWEGAAHKDGIIDDSTQFWNMWQAVVNKYNGSDSVYFEIFNEPFGYSLTQWKAVCTQWLKTFPQVPRCRVLVGGSSYDDFVVFMGADSSFNGCLLSQHIYPWWGNFNTTGNWQSALQTRIAPFENRTIVTEFGAPMTTGIDYSQAANGNINISFIQGINAELNTGKIGSCYWPGLRDSDSYSIQLLRNDSMFTTNPSGALQLRYGWRQ